LEHQGATDPNPPVGCALLDTDGAVIAVSAHQRAGKPHAEALAIAEAARLGLAHRAHTAVVTLEPCNHWGRTPPCASALLQAGVRRVVIAQPDPNPAVTGGGALRLTAEGVEVVWLQPGAPAKLHAETARLIAPFAKRVRTGLPWVTIKQAMTTGGSMIPPPAQKTFTSPQSLEFAHRLRRRAGAILTGSGTILADNPAFTVRLVADHPGKRRHLVILDRRARTPDRYMAEAAARGFIPSRAVAIEDALRQLAAAGVNEVLVEAGPTLTAALLSGPYWDEHITICQRTNGAPDEITTVLNPRSAKAA
jgi:diaminohydroxyphosphoribosylaminopyrimidine deaminase/5-amino-6-(5-phosphoribosylamino)uracil reductase